ncbi:MAG TPA: DNA adenine methylase [Acidimicrobiales bacterium]|jgi:adenine-specific DNA-methyltransferase|nr:DNA adenine methylase [Acidimicrobiales bacterium]
MIKYLGSKRRLVPVLGELLERSGVDRALDLFTGTTRVAQEWKRRGAHVTAVDSARYAAVLARCYIETDLSEVDVEGIRAVLCQLQELEGHDGYVTETFSRNARFFQEHNARRIDAIRDAIDEGWRGHPWEPVLLTSLLQAADRVDSTTGVQMAYLKSWAPRSYQPLELRMPELLAGPGRAVHGDITEVVATLDEAGLAYLDPPYNQHRYGGNYHVWETLMAWDAPEHYGVACKRVDLREPSTASVFNRRREAPAALARLIAEVPAETIVISGSDEGWIGVDDLADMAAGRGPVEVMAFDSKRYVGAQIGIHNPQGQRVGRVGRTRNVEYIILAGARARQMVSR